MDKEKYIGQLYLVDRVIIKKLKEFINKWPEQPQLDSSEHEEWYIDVLTLMHMFPEIEFGCFYSGDEGNEFVGRKPIWIDPSIRNKVGLDEFEGKEREELLFKIRREMGRLLFESARLVIPIYPDTTKEDIEGIWPRINELKKLAYGKIPSPRKTKWEENVVIYRFGQFQETVKEHTGKLGAPWNNIADQLQISPQACRERYISIKGFINLHTNEKNQEGDIKEATIQNLDCPTCEERDKCKLYTTGRGACPFVEKILGKGEISSQSYISVDQIEDKEARDYGHWRAEDDFINSLDMD
jgi:hypothetical protein